VAYAYLEVCLSSFDKTLGSPLPGELASLVEFDAWFDLPWFRGSMVFCIAKPYAFLATLLSWNVVLPSPWLGLRGSLCFFLYIVYFASSYISSYAPKSLCFTCYTSLYLLNYAYHCARMSSNEM
jgi:hypothetical protein